MTNRTQFTPGIEGLEEIVSKTNIIGSEAADALAAQLPHTADTNAIAFLRDTPPSAKPDILAMGKSGSPFAKRLESKRPKRERS